MVDLSKAFAKFAGKESQPKPAVIVVSEPEMPKESVAVKIDAALTLTLDARPPESTAFTGHQLETGELQVSNKQELSHLNVEAAGLEPQDSTPVRQDLVKAATLNKRIALESGKDVRGLCDEIDSMIGNFDNLLVGPSLIQLRGYVMTLMVTLKQNPEFDSVMIDKDVRNVMRVIRSIREEALASRSIKEVKREVKKAKASAGSAKKSILSNAFAQVMLAQSAPQGE